MQTDGNLVLHDSSGKPHWASQTSGNPGAFLNVQNDGNLVVYRAGSTTETANNALWAAGSNTPGAMSIDKVNDDQYAGPPDGSANDPVLEQPWINIWIGDALQAAGLPVTEDWLNGFLTLCNRESSYMPNAVNTTDSNAVGPIVGDGNPQGCSRGVAQCTPSTFAAYHVVGTSTSIYDPVANIAAASQYVRNCVCCGYVSRTVLTSPPRFNRRTRTGPRMGTAHIRMGTAHVRTARPVRRGELVNPTERSPRIRRGGHVPVRTAP